LNVEQGISNIEGEIAAALRFRFPHTKFRKKPILRLNSGQVSCGVGNPRQCGGLTIWSGSGIYGSDEGGSRTAPTFGGKQIRATTWGCPYVEQRNGTVTVVRNIADYALGKLKIKM